jgi:hypothetical protein
MSWFVNIRRYLFALASSAIFSGLISKLSERKHNVFASSMLTYAWFGENVSLQYTKSSNTSAQSAVHKTDDRYNFCAYQISY